MAAKHPDDNQKCVQEDAKDDPFGEDDDFFSSIEISQYMKRPSTSDPEVYSTPKRVKQNEPTPLKVEGNYNAELIQGADPFDDSGDEVCEIADMKGPDTSQPDAPPKCVKGIESGPIPEVEENVLNDVVAADDEDDPFDDSGDELELCEIANILEVSAQVFGDELFMPDQVEQVDEAVPPQNRFTTGLGRPHPLLVPHIYETILSHLTTKQSISAARLVCKSWNDTLLKSVSSTFTVRNVSHVVENYPYGLGYNLNDISTPLPPIAITRIHIADPCIVFTKQVVKKYFQNQGCNITHLSFDANLWCDEHWRFLGNVLFNWCGNLESLELVGVTCIDALITYSEMSGAGKLLTLKRLVVKWGSEIVRHHHHFSTVRLKMFNQRRFMISRLCSRRDGGIIGKIFRHSPALTEFVLHFDFHSISSYFAYFRVMDIPVRMITVLEIVGTGGIGINSMDIRLLDSCEMRLAKLVIGPICSNVRGPLLERFLRNQRWSLHHLEIRGVKGSRNYNNWLDHVTVNLPEMHTLKVLKISDVSRFRIGNLAFLYRMDRLETLHLGCAEVQQRFKTRAFRIINRMFYGCERPHPLKEFCFTGVYAHVLDHVVAGGLFARLFKRLETLRVGSGGNFNAFKNCVRGYVAVEGITEMGINIGGEDVMREHALGSAINEFIGAYHNLRIFSVSVTGDVRLRLTDVQAFRKLYRAEFAGFLIHDEEAAGIADCVARKFNFAVFKNLRIFKAGIRERLVGYVGRKPMYVNQIIITLVNLPVVLRGEFKRI